MKRLLIALVACGLMVGCRGSDDSESVPKQEMLNPSGQLAPEQGQVAQQRNEAGQRANAAMDEAARQMKEAQARSGGK